MFIALTYRVVMIDQFSIPAFLVLRWNALSQSIDKTEIIHKPIYKKSCLLQEFERSQDSFYVNRVTGTFTFIIWHTCFFKAPYKCTEYPPSIQAKQI